jgi:hypothetical protein
MGRKMIHKMKMLYRDPKEQIVILCTTFKRKLLLSKHLALEVRISARNYPLLLNYFEPTA